MTETWSDKTDWGLIEHVPSARWEGDEGTAGRLTLNPLEPYHSTRMGKDDARALACFILTAIGEHSWRRPATPGSVAAPTNPFERNRAANWRDSLDANGVPTRSPEKVDYGCHYCGGGLDANPGIGQYECPWCVARFKDCDAHAGGGQ